MATTALPPAHEVFRSYARDLIALPGVLFTGWSAKAPDSIHVDFQTPELRELGDGVLRDTVDGATIVTEVPEAERRRDPGASTQPPWQTKPANMARAVAGMPGVIDSQFNGMTRTFTFLTTTKEVSEHLRSLVSEQFGQYGTRFYKQGTEPDPRP